MKFESSINTHRYITRIVPVYKRNKVCLNKINIKISMDGKSNYFGMGPKKKGQSKKRQRCDKSNVILGAKTPVLVEYKIIIP